MYMQCAFAPETDDPDPQSAPPEGQNCHPDPGKKALEHPDGDLIRACGSSSAFRVGRNATWAKNIPPIQTALAS